MSYQVLARKWRPQRFDDVVGQPGVTRTLRNAIASGRVGHAFVFAGPRGCGKTTTARILARALNCVSGPTPDPCGACDACVEIAQGRDLDVLEIDAASHTQIDNIREVVLAGLAIAPARNRYKIFIIDEVHQLSAHSFNALLKSVEEPPSHVVFIMATTELHKIPDTILSRSQVFEFRAIQARAIAGQLRQIAAAERLEVSDAALALIARAAEGSMRDAQSALDQVTAFAGDTIGVDDVATVLGLVGRDLLLDLIEAVVAEDAPRAFAAADRAIETGHDPRLVVRDLTRAVRDMMVLSIDPERAGDGEMDDGERERLAEVSRAFSREDLLRAFDLLAKAEQEIVHASDPRYHFEMLLLRWMHLRKLVPLVDLLASSQNPNPKSQIPNPKPQTPNLKSRISDPRPAPSHPRTVAPSHPSDPAPSHSSSTAPSHPRTVAPLPPSDASLKDALLAEIKTSKSTLYSLAIAMAQRIDVAGDRVVFTFAPNQAVAQMQLDQNREWIEAMVQRLTGRRIPVTIAQGEGNGGGAPPVAAPEPNPTQARTEGTRDLRAEAMTSAAVQAVLDVFPAEIRDVEEL